MDIDGKFVPESNLYGEQLNLEIIHPEYILFADETGLNTNFKEEDKNEGNTKFACGLSEVPKTKCNTLDNQ